MLVEGVRVPFTTVLTEYKDLLAYDLATGALRYLVKWLFRVYDENLVAVCLVYVGVTFQLLPQVQ